uniref:Uncharacterized protein n=1 Tax=Trichobilharzia regenti TaxID=157069 RepID=A0AA85JL50_TRIRE|nr:unnamed protein product [Trichobilharzia regenti]
MKKFLSVLFVLVVVAACFDMASGSPEKAKDDVYADEEKKETPKPTQKPKPKPADKKRDRRSSQSGKKGVKSSSPAKNFGSPILFLVAPIIATKFLF